MIRDLVEWEPLQETFEYKVAGGIQDITNYDKLAIVVGKCYALRLPYVKVWQSIVNVVLMAHAEMTDEQLISILWHVCKSVKSRD